jgi:hypothetical protein
MRRDERDPLDCILDDALAAYANQEPLPGLEQRVLNRTIRARDRNPWAFLLRWALPVAALSCILAGIVLWKRDAGAPAPRAIVRSEARPPAPVATAVKSEKPPRRRRPITAHLATAPKQPEFPIPAPVTRQERALVTFARNAPEEALQAFRDRGVAAIEPLQVPEIHLQPLPIGDGAQ